MLLVDIQDGIVMQGVTLEIVHLLRSVRLMPHSARAWVSPIDTEGRLPS